jgi:hypothetical protein
MTGCRDDPVHVAMSTRCMVGSMPRHSTGAAAFVCECISCMQGKIHTSASGICADISDAGVNECNMQACQQACCTSVCGHAIQLTMAPGSPLARRAPESSHRLTLWHMQCQVSLQHTNARSCAAKGVSGNDNQRAQEPSHAVRDADEPAAMAIAARQALQSWCERDVRDGRTVMVHGVCGPCHLPTSLSTGRRLHGWWVYVVHVLCQCPIA